MCSVTQKYTTTSRTPGLKTLGFFVFAKGKMTKIDYTELNNRIIEQAYETVFGHELSKEQLQKLIQNKFERARVYHEALAKSPLSSVN